MSQQLYPKVKKSPNRFKIWMITATSLDKSGNERAYTKHFYTELGARWAAWKLIRATKKGKTGVIRVEIDHPIAPYL